MPWLYIRTVNGHTSRGEPFRALHCCCLHFHHRWPDHGRHASFPRWHPRWSETIHSFLQAIREDRGGAPLFYAPDETPDNELDNELRWLQESKGKQITDTSTYAMAADSDEHDVGHTPNDDDYVIEQHPFAANSSIELSTIKSSESSDT